MSWPSIAFVNAERKATSDDIAALVLATSDSERPWCALIIAEPDGYASDLVDPPCLLGFRIRRFWPDVGTYAFYVVIRESDAHKVSRVRAHGRCISLCLAPDDKRAILPHDSCMQSFYIFVHGDPGDPGNTLLELARLLQGRPRGSFVTVMGDFNINIMPKYGENWDKLEDWVKDKIEIDTKNRDFKDTIMNGTMNLDILEETMREMTLDHIEFVCEDDGRSFLPYAPSIPITRVPNGEQTGNACCIDHVWSNHVQAQARLDWNCNPGDHALISFECGARANLITNGCLLRFVRRTQCWHGRWQGRWSQTILWTSTICEKRYTSCKI